MVNENKPKGPTAGYPEIERLVDTEDFDDVNEKFQKAYDSLEEIARQKRGLKKSREAKKAMAAIELTMDLFRELLTIKYRLQEIAAQRQTQNPPKE
jgi:predicted phage gp36 major capsid-like protein